MPFIFDATSAAGKLSAYALALPPAYWMINDAHATWGCRWSVGIYRLSLFGRLYFL